MILSALKPTLAWHQGELCIAAGTCWLTLRHQAQEVRVRGREAVEQVHGALVRTLTALNSGTDSLERVSHLGDAPVALRAYSCSLRLIIGEHSVRLPEKALLELLEWLECCRDEGHETVGPSDPAAGHIGATIWQDGARVKVEFCDQQGDELVASLLKLAATPGAARGGTFELACGSRFDLWTSEAQTTVFWFFTGEMTGRQWALSRTATVALAAELARSLGRKEHNGTVGLYA